ncbi:MAG: hypothetical protein M0R46_02530 [Candidatus Muirbacterium halophilum]|nr:hypothetical protein [Candidatus Muirbacterium halophilum]MCK9474766.1 hypothetical protein [Candidatus Muirbacterium halophilum]
MEDNLADIFIILEKLHRTFLDLICVENDKKALLLGEYKAEDLLPIISKEEFLAKKIAYTEKEIKDFFSEGEYKGCNITSLLNKNINNNELHTKISTIQEHIHKCILEYSEIRTINDSILRTEASFYGYLFRKLYKSNTYSKDNKGHRVNTFNTVA